MELIKDSVPIKVFKNIHGEFLGDINQQKLKIAQGSLSEFEVEE